MLTDIRFLEIIGQYLYAHATLVYLLFSPTGRVLDANAYSRKLFGESVQQMGVGDIFLAFAQAVDITRLTTWEEMPQLLSVATAAGLPESFLFHFFALGENILALGRINTDETLQLRQELLDLNGQLNGLTRELQKKNHQLAKLNTLKNQFLGMAAHDLRKPVSAVLNYSEFLLDETGDILGDEHLGFLRTIHSSTDLMRRLIDDFLDISLIESGRLQLTYGRVDILGPVARSLDLQKIMAKKRGVNLRLLHSGTAGVIEMDEYKIEQVLNNLISNAIEHTPANSEVTVQVSATEAEVLVAVSDSGPGIGEEEKERIFALYERGRARKAAGSRSTGLGLAISRKIIEAHQGRIWVENRLGQGAQFCFLLPKNIVLHEETPRFSAADNITGERLHD